MKFKKHSKKREVIYTTLKDNPIHPSAEQLHGILVKKDINYGIATVYRNLNLFVEEGRAQKFRGLNGAEHFDHTMHAHAHFICEGCGYIEDIPLPRGYEDFLEALKKKNKVSVSASKVIISGACRKCRLNVLKNKVFKRA